jgi:hypothetical protein
MDPPSQNDQDELDQEICNLEAIHQQTEKRNEKMLWVSQLQKQFDEVSEQLCNITQQVKQPEEPCHQNNLCHEEQGFDNFMYDGASWQQNYKPHHDHHYIGHPSCQCMMAYQIQSYNIILWWQYDGDGKVFLSWQSRLWLRLGIHLSNRELSHHGRSAKTCSSPVFKVSRRSHHYTSPVPKHTRAR